MTSEHFALSRLVIPGDSEHHRLHHITVDKKAIVYTGEANHLHGTLFEVPHRERQLRH